MKRIPVLIFGVGGVGRALIRQIVHSRPVVAGRNQCHFDIVGLVDSRSWLWEPDGLADEDLNRAAIVKEQGQPLGDGRATDLEALAQLETSGLVRPIVVDVTAADGMEAVIDQALAMDCGVVLANKKPLAGPWEMARRYYHNPALRHESTVGGGQPVIATLRYLLDTNDPVLMIEGQMSGTLGYICERLDTAVPFSRALAEAKTLGYTEPDPREDLGGSDVMRKTMILGRMAGWPLEESDIEVEVLYHPSLAHLPVAEFMEAAVAMDPSMADRVRDAQAADNVLRYTARVDENGGFVGLQALAKTNPLAHLKYISFSTANYQEPPLMIGGKGAGIEMTAAGVLGDMIGLVREGVAGP